MNESNHAARLVGAALAIAVVASAVLVGCAKSQAAAPAPVIPMQRVEDVSSKLGASLSKTYSTDYFTVYEYMPTDRSRSCVIVNGVRGLTVSC